MAGRLAAAGTALGFAAPLLSGCSAKGGQPNRDYRPLIMTLLELVIPGSAKAQNADFVARAVTAGIMGVPIDMLAQLEKTLNQAAGDEFARKPPKVQAEVIGKIDADTFAAGAARPSPWYSTKALLLMAFYTSEDGMTKELRYELVPGRYDSDVVIDANWRPLSNDWQAVAISGGIVGK